MSFKSFYFTTFFVFCFFLCLLLRVFLLSFSKKILTLAFISSIIVLNLVASNDILMLSGILIPQDYTVRHVYSYKTLQGMVLMHHVYLIPDLNVKLLIKKIFYII